MTFARIGVVIGLFIVTAMGGCRAEQRGLGRNELLAGLEALAGPAHQRQQREQLVDDWWANGSTPLPATSQNSPLGAFRRSFARGAISDAKAFAAASATLDVTQPDAALHQCLSARALDLPDETVAACTNAIERNIDSNSILGALAALWETRVERERVFDVVGKNIGRWRARACNDGSNCAHLGTIFDEVAAKVADHQGPKAFAAAIEDSGRLLQAVVDGPYASSAIDAVWRWPNIAPRPYRFSSTTRSAARGRFAPSRRNESGAYRLGFQVEATGTGFLVVNGPRLFRAFVDGVEVAQSDGTDSERWWTALELGRGRHQIDVVLASEGFDAEIDVSLVDDHGKSWGRLVDAGLSDRPARKDASVIAYAQLDRARTSNSPSTLAPRLTSSLCSIGDSSAASREGDGEMDPYAPLDRLLSCAEAIDAGFLSGASRDLVIRALLEDWGDAPASKFAVSRLLRNHTTRGTPSTRAKRKSTDAAVLLAWPHHASTWLTTIDAVVDQSPYRAFALAQQAWKAAPTSVRVAQKLASTALALDANGVALTAIRDGLRISTTRDMLEAAIMVFDAASLFEDGGAVRDALLRRQDFASLNSRVQILLARGERTKALALLQQQSNQSEGHAAEELRLDLVGTTDLPRALSRVQTLCHHFPNDRQLAMREVELLSLSGRRADAIARLSALNLQFGSDRDLRTWASEMTNSESGERERTEGDVVTAAFRARDDDPFNGRAGGYLLDKTSVQFFRDGSRITTRHELFQVKTKEAIDAWGEIALSYDSQMVRLVVRKPDGAIFLPERHEELGAASLTGLAPNDVVEIIQKRFSSSSVGEMFDEVGAIFQTDTPALRRVFEVRLPQLPNRGDNDVVLTTVVGNGAPQATRSVAVDSVTGEAVDVMTFAQEDMEPILPEPLSAPAVMDLPFVVGARGVTLDALSRARFQRWFDHPLSSHRPPRGLVRVAKQIAPTSSAVTQFEALFSFVSREISPGSENDPERALLHGEGARTPLLFSLAKGLGLDVELIGIHLPVTGNIDLPTTSRFALNAVMLRDDGAPVAVAVVQAGTALFNAIPPVDGAAYIALRLNGASDVLPLPPFAMKAPPLDVKLVLGPQARPTASGSDGGITTRALAGLLTLRVPPHRAHGLREAFAQSDDDGRRAAFESILGQSFPGMVVDAVTLPNLEDEGTPLGIGVTLRVPLAEGREIEWPSIFEDSVAASIGSEVGLGAMLSLTQRLRTAIMTPRAERFSLQIDLGTLGSFTDVPRNYDVTAGPVQMTQSVEIGDSRLRLQRDISVTGAFIRPAEFAELRPEWVAILKRSKLGLRFLSPTPRTSATVRESRGALVTRQK